MQLCLSPSKIHIDAPLEQLAALAAQAGFEALEFYPSLEDDPALVRDTLAKHGLAMGAFGVHAPMWREESAEGFAGGMEWFGRLVPHLAQMGVRTLAVWMLPGSDTRSYADNFAWHAERLGAVATVGAEHGMNLAIEFVAPFTARRGYRHTFIHTIQQTLELCEAVGPTAGLLLDAWHWYTSLGTLSDLRDIPRSRLHLLHINDAPRGIPIEQQDDLTRHLPAETGVIDIGGFFEAMRAVGYDGLVVAEPFDARLAHFSPADAAARTMASMRAALAAPPHAVLPATQKALATGAGKARVVEIPVPRPVGNQVIVKLHASLICGSNMHQFRGEHESVNAGHEGAGEVVAVAHSTRLKVGDRVALSPLNACGNCGYCRRGEAILCPHRPEVHGHFCQYTRVADVMCTLLPEDISYRHGALLGCGLGPAYGALRHVEAGAFDTVVIMGLGPVGLGATALATYLNARVVAVDTEGYRRGVAEALGAQVVLDPTAPDFQASIRSALGEYGLLKGIDCSGASAAERTLIDLAAPLARIAFVGENWSGLTVSPSNDFIRKQLTVAGVWHMNVLDQGDLITFLRRAPEKADLLVTHCFGFEQAQEAFEVFASRQAVKVALEPFRGESGGTAEG